MIIHPTGCAAAAEIVMVAGYALYDAFLAGSLAVGMTGVPGNIVQGAFGAAASTLLCPGAAAQRLCPQGVPAALKKS